MSKIEVNPAVHLFPAVHLSKAAKLAAKRNGLSTPAFYQYVSITPIEMDNENVVLHVFSKKLAKSVAITGADIWLAEILLTEGLEK